MYTMKQLIFLLISAFILLLLESCSIISPLNHVVVSVSFSSACCGPNPQTTKALLKFLEQDKKSRGFAVSYTDRDWGREGEFTRCFPLTELPPPEKQLFITGLRQKLTGYRLVSVTETTSCPQ
jgi:hypothetical protein